MSKRSADHELNKDNWEEADETNNGDENNEEGSWQAKPEQLKQRVSEADQNSNITATPGSFSHVI